MPRLPTALLLLVLSPGVLADYDTGERLYQDCSSKNEFLRGYCGGYVVGVIATMVNMQRYRQLPDSVLCVPAEVSKGQLVEVVTKYLESNPPRRSRQAINLVPEALNEAYPCAATAPGGT
jgi:hypothetical protein